MSTDRQQVSTGGNRQSTRHRQLIDVVVEHGSISLEDLAENLGVSLMTVHRDLDKLAGHGVIRKTRGTATALPSSAIESNDVYRRAQQRNEKAELAAAALEAVQSGQTVMLDDSTTVLPLLDLLPGRAPLTVVSNSLSVVNALAPADDISVVVVGGDYHRWCNAFMGQMTTDSLQDLRVDLLIMSTSAVVDGSCYHQRQDTVATKRAMMQSATERILLLDHTKFERRALHRLGPVTDFTRIIVNSKTPSARVAELRDIGVDVHIAEPLH